MKSNKIIVLIITLMVSLTFSFYYSVNVKADSGFDSSWDSGGSSDSGSSWDSGSSHSSTYSGGGTGGGSFSYDDNKGMALFFELFSSIHWYLFVLRPLAGIFIKDSNKSKKLGIIFLAIRIIALLLLNKTFPGLFLIDFITLFPLAFIFSFFQIKKDIKVNSSSSYQSLSNEEILSKLGNNFNVQNFYNETFNIYKEVQIAWMDLDIERVRNILSDEMFNTYKMQLETLKVKNQKNMMEDINLVDVYITNIYQKNNQDVIDVIMKVTCRDYLIDINSNKVLRGEKNKVWNYEYKLSYMRTNISNELNYCPNCGAKLSEGSSIKCSYCNAIINKETDKFILIDKKMLSQR